MMKISRLASWIGPTYVGTIASSWLAITAYLFLPRSSHVLGDPWITWLLLATVATPVASLLATTMLVVDVILLKFKVCALPTGKRALGMSLLAPLPVAASLWYFWPGSAAPLSTFAFLVIAPILVTALGVRLSLGTPIKHA
ncbi:MAG: hypothetical protein NZX77_21065 [Polyangiaceae bacterium]|nr:hypothetical protein [Polyangiaceae bacterium]